MTALQILETKSARYDIGKLPVVILPLEDYEKIKEELEMFNSKALPGKIKKAREEIRNGKGLTMEEVKKQLKLSA
jgi:PHD/YefM family antitoxin component YafN of YafNO toxin-antitoxin module